MSKSMKAVAWAAPQSVPTFTHSLLALLAVGLLALAGCATPGASSSATADPGSAMMNAYGGYKAAWNRHDVAAIVGYYGENGAYHNPSVGRPLSGAAFAGWLKGLFAAIPDFRVEIVSADPAGDQRLAEQWVITGTWTKPFPAGPLAGAQPTGKSFTVPGAGFLEWKDGKIVSSTQYFDQMAFLTQIGVIAQK